MKNYLIAIAILAVCWLLSIDVVQEKGFELFKTTSDIAKDITPEVEEGEEGMESKVLEAEKSKIHDWRK